MERFTPRTLPIILGLCTVAVFTGTALVGWSATLRAFTNETAAMNLYARWCDVSDSFPNDSVGNRFYSYWTNKHLLHDAGVGLIAAGVTISGLAAGLWLKRFPGIAWARTPAHRWTFVAIGCGVVAACWAGVMYGLVIDQRRFAFPPCADTIIIPMMGITGLAVIGTPILATVGFTITLAFGKLPASLMQWDRDRPRLAWSVTIAAVMIGMGLVLMTISMMVSSSAVGTPGAVAALYLIASTRAAILSRSAIVADAEAQR